MKYIFSLALLISNYQWLVAQNEAQIDSLVRVAEESGDSIRTKIYGDLCWNLKFSDPESAVQFGKKAIQSSNRLQTRSSAAQAHSDLGMVYYLTSAYSEANYHYDTAIQIYTHLGDTFGITKITGRKGAIHQKLGQMDKALELFLAALKLSQSIGNEQLASYDMNNVAIVYMDQQQYDKALEYFLLSLEIKEKLNDKYQISGTLLNIGSVHQYLGEFENALKYYEKSIVMCREVGQTEYLSAVLNNYGGLLVDMGKTNIARKPLEESIQIRRNSKDMRGLTSSLVNLGRANLAEKRFAISNSQLDEALKIALDLNAKDAIQKAYGALAEMYAAMNQYKKAFEYHTLFSVARDSFLNEQSTRQLAEMRTRFETEEKEQEIIDLNREKLLQASLIREKDLEIQRNGILTITITVILIALMVIVYLYFNRKQLKQQNTFEQEKSALRSEQLQAVINSQEAERKRFAMDLHDDFGQLISALRINLNQFNSQTNDRANKANGILDDMYVSLKSIAFNLMPQTLVEKGLEPALSELCHQLDSLGHISFTMRSFDVEDLELSDTHKVATYRIVQEVMNNIIKYSGATNVDINLTGLDNELNIMIEDNGDGFDHKMLTMGNGNGWRNIGSRLDLMSGEIDYDTQPGRKNTTVSITIPYVVPQKVAA